MTTSLYWPALLQILVTLALYFFTFRVRIGLVKSGEARVSDFRTYENEHPESRKWARAIANQFELPVIFYALCVMATLIGFADLGMIVLAWLFSLLKTAHVFLHVTANRIRYRQPVFALAFLALTAMTVWFSYKLAVG